jgi:hypothetical protein
VVSGEWIAAALFCLSEIGEISVDLANELVRLLLQFTHEVFISIALIQARVKIVDHLICRAASDAAEANVLLVMPAAMSFSDVVRNRNSGAPHLAC